jgi:NAD+ kinase
MTAMNEVLIDRGPSPFLTRLETYCDGVYTTTVQADGLIVATPTGTFRLHVLGALPPMAECGRCVPFYAGSTAYSLSAGGSMVHPLVPCILFTPVCPHSLSFRPLIFPDSAELKIKVPAGSRSSAWLTCDGRNRLELLANDRHAPFYVSATLLTDSDGARNWCDFSVTIRMSEWPVPVVCRNDETSDWFHSVTEILHWNERKTQKPTL